VRRLLVAAPAALLLLTACAASDPVAERRSAVAAITGAANDGDVDGVRDEVSDLLSVLREQVANEDLDRAEADRLRAIAEHGGMERSKDRRRTTHVIRQSRLARFYMVPYRTGWHLAHHVDMGVPWRNLPRLHDELVASGWLVLDIQYPSYRAFWKACSAGSARSEAAAPHAAASSFLDFS